MNNFPERIDTDYGYLNRDAVRKLYKNHYKTKNKIKKPFHINFDELEVYNCTGESFNGIMTENHILIYLEIIYGEKNKIYYKLGEVHNKDFINGFTSRDVHIKSYSSEKRISAPNSNTVITHFILKRIPGKSRDYDKDIHRKINSFRQKNYCPFRSSYKERGTNNEEFLNDYNDSKEHFDILKSILEDYTGIKPSPKIAFEYRKNQKFILGQAIKTLKLYGKCLLNAYTGFGKSAISPKIAVEICNPGDVVLVTTPIVDTLNDFENNINNIDYGTDIAYIDIRKENDILAKINEYQKENKIIFILSSVQYARYGEKDALREKLYLINNIGIKIWMRDEYHREYNGIVTSKVFRNIKPEYTLDMTATIYKLIELYGHEYSKKMIIKFDIFDVLYEKIFKKNPLFDDFPFSEIMFPNFNDVFLSDRLKSIFSDEDRYNPKKYYELDKNGNFIYKDYILDHAKIRFDNMILNENGRYERHPKIKENSFLIPEHKSVGYYIIPEGNSEVNTQEIGLKLKKLLNNTIEKAVFYTANDFLNESEIGKSSDEIVNEWKDNNPNKKIVIITHKQLTTGSNIKALDFMVLMNSIFSADEFVQVFGRMTRVYEDKNEVTMYIDCPNMKLIVADNIIDTIRYKTDNQKLQKEFFDCIPIQLDGISHKKIKFEEAIDYHNKRLNRLFGNSFLSSTVINRFPGFLFKIANVPYDKMVGGSKDDGKQLTDDNGSKVNKSEKHKNSNEKNNQKNGNKKDHPKILTIISMINESISIGIIEKHKKFDDIYNKSKLAKLYFSKNNINMMKIGLTDDDFNRAINNWYDNIMSEINGMGLSIEEIILLDKYFINQKFKSKQGLVFVPRELAEEILNSPYLNNRDARRKIEYGTIGVVNSLNGMLPILLREKYPNAKIICLEYFPYYITHLDNMGLKVYQVEYKNKEIVLPKKVNNMKFDFIVGNPPYQGSISKSGRGKPVLHYGTNLFLNL